ncbi:MAG: hypothetical protein EX271_04520 [Acidimicrobiales bacterium]|nr:MAG: hypothetical protein EX271_04520 [Acidimicrobiales bacterium]
MRSTVNTKVEKNVQNNQIKPKLVFSPRILAFALLLVLFCTFIFMAFPDPITNAGCLDDTPECVAAQKGSQNYVFWIGVFLCSLFGLILMTFKPGQVKKAPTVYLSLSAAAALNTAMWMALVYAGAFLINLI